VKITTGKFDKETSMNTSILRNLLPLSLLAILGPVQAMADDMAHFKVPFDFTVGNHQLFAGEYIVGRTSPSVLTIRTGTGQAVLMTLANVGSPSRVPGILSLTFDKVDNRYFLSQWSGSDYGLQLIKPAVEKELLAKRAARKPVTVVASSLK
jgi:hypothetical protein